MDGVLFLVPRCHCVATACCFLPLGSRPPASISMFSHFRAKTDAGVSGCGSKRYIILSVARNILPSTEVLTNSLPSSLPPVLIASSVLVLQGPLKQASKFAEQLSGAVNQKVMEIGDAANSPGVDAAKLEGTEAAVAATAAAAGGAAGVGMAQGWKPPTTELGMDEELANDVPSELTIDEQVSLLK